MPAIAPIENLKVAQKEGLSINAMLHACLPEARRSARVCTTYASRFTIYCKKGEGGRDFRKAK